MMYSNGELEYEEELDFHLETASDTSLDNDNTLSGQNSYSDVRHMTFQVWDCDIVFLFAVL